MARRILMLTSTWDGEYSKAIIAGILERIEEEDVELHIMNAYDTGAEADFFRKGREIYSLPSPDMYDGLIIALTTLGSLGFVNETSARFHEAGKPVVGVDTRADNAIFCGLDNYQSMYQLVEHMVNIHDCRTINYLGGPEDNEESRERYRAFCDCLASHGINVEKRRVLHKRFWKSDGASAYREWKERGVNMADVVICANDYMAMGYIDEAVKDGVTVPDYIKVTGFDNIVEAQRYFPSITSVNRNRKMLGYESMDALLEAVDGNIEYDTRFVKGYVCYNESCGCDLTRDIRSDYNEVIEKTNRELEIGLKYSYSRQALSKCRSMDDYPKALAESKRLLSLDDIAVCLNRSYFEGDPDGEYTGYDDDMVLYTDEGKKEINRNDEMYPEGWKGKEKAFIFSSLRSSTRTFGYAVMPYRSDYFNRLKHRTFIETLSLSLDIISHKMALDNLKQNKS